MRKISKNPVLKTIVYMQRKKAAPLTPKKTQNCPWRLVISKENFTFIE